MANPYLSVVVPSYNESLALKKDAIQVMDEYLSQQKYDYEVLVVDDESTNNTVDEIEREIRRKKNFKLLRNEHGGKAITVMTGLLKSTGGYAIFTDMDQATPIDQIAKLLPKLEEEYDLVIGARKGRKGAPMLRKLAALVFQIMRNIILGIPFKDTQCGFKGFNRRAIEAIFPKMLEDWQKVKSSGAAVNASFDVDFLYRAKKEELKVTDVEVEWHHVANEKQVSLIREGISSIKDMLKIKLNDLAGKYNS